MKALLLKLSFFEAFFKVHYTKGFRLSYPIPLPPSVAGVFGAFLGIERKSILNEAKSMLFGAKLVSYRGISPENATLLQYKSMGSKPTKTIAYLYVINDPIYLMAIAGEENKIEEVKEKLENSVKYLPYGGQNDFFIKDWKFIGLTNVEESYEISNYAPQDLVETLLKGVEVEILPVRHNFSENPNFYFVISGSLKLKQKIPCISNEKIAIYPLEKFFYQIN
jgi:CRISPR-associated protein Cas5 subtype I-B